MRRLRVLTVLQVLLLLTIAGAWWYLLREAGMLDPYWNIMGPR